MKICSQCKTDKNIEDFYLAKGKPMSKCKHCMMTNKLKNAKLKDSSVWWHRRYERLKRQAIKRGKQFTLTFTEAKSLWQIKNCYYCELPATVQTIDRVDNSKPYEKDNCVMACWNCNRKKSTFTLVEIKMFYEKMIPFHQK